MAAHHQLLYHIVFSVKDRRPLLRQDEFRLNTWAYMGGLVNRIGGCPLNIGGYYDHAHLLVNIPAKKSVSDFVRLIKTNTSKHINEQGSLNRRFQWQSGFGAFTVSQSLRHRVSQYIDNQLEHHRQTSFQDEFLSLLARHNLSYDEQYIWE